MIRNKIMLHWGIGIAVVLFLAGCAAGQGTPIPPAASAPAPTPQPTNTLTTRTATPALVTFAPDVYAGWLTYTNAPYKFLLRYPSDWTYREIQGAQNTMSGHAVHLEPRSTSLVRLVVGFKRAAEAAKITRTGVGAGEIVLRGWVTFLGQPLSREVLELNGNDIAVLYQGSAEIRRGDLVFTLSLDYRGSQTDKTALTPEMETTSDKIVASFELIR